MKLILIVLIIAQIYGAFSEGQRTSMHMWNFSSSIAFPVFQGTDAAIAAVMDAIHDVTLWKGGQVDTRLNLLTELKSFELGLEQSILELTQSFLNGTITIQYRSLLSKLNFFLKIYLNNINDMIIILIPTMQDLTATRAITSCLHVVQLIEEIIEKIHGLLSS